MQKGFRHHRLKGRVRGQKLPLFWLILLSLIVVLGILLLPLIKIWQGPFGDFLGNASTIRQSKYLVLLQNEAELRPTGGFLSAIAVVEMNGGDPQVSIYDSYAITPPAETFSAPAPIETVFSQDPKYRGWVLRDANFSADFSESVATVLEFLQFDGRFADQQFDGVIAVNFGAIVDLVEAHFGSINGIPPDRLFLELQRETKDVDLHSEAELASRKDILQELSRQIIDGIGYFGAPEMLETIAQSADKKDIQFWFADAELWSKVRQKGWGGELPESGFFGVNMANLGAKKSDRYIQKYYYSEISVAADENVTEWFSARIKHAGRNNLLSGEGQYYIRVFRPLGTTLIASAQEWEQKTVEGGYEEFSTLVTLRPGEKQEISVNFQYPESWGEGDRIFPWISQSGSDEALFLTVRGTGETFFEASGCDVSRPRDNVLFCDVRLVGDRTLGLRKFPDRYPPLLENAFFDNSKEIFLRFSEAIAPQGISAENVNLRCDSFTYPMDLVVRNENELRDARLVLAGEIEFTEDFCSLEIGDVTDVSGNSNDITITLPLREGNV